MKKKFVWTLVLLASLALLAVYFGSSGLKWTEFVKLPDGRIVTLERRVEFNGPNGAFGNPSTESEQHLKFKHPTTAEVIQWENLKEQGMLHTVALWFEQDRPVLLARPAYGDDSIKYNCPNPPYLLYEYVSGQWQSKSLAEIRIKKIRSNLTTLPLSMRDEIKKKHNLTAEQTSDSYTYLEGVKKVPYIIKFEGMPKQTFVKYENCDKPFNYLISNGED